MLPTYVPSSWNVVAVIVSVATHNPIHRPEKHTLVDESRNGFFFEVATELLLLGFVHVIGHSPFVDHPDLH
jgi:hypothetical protein